MNFIVLMFKLYEIRLDVRNGDFLHANVPIYRVNDLGVIVEREYWGGFVEAVDEANFLLVCHLMKRG